MRQFKVNVPLEEHEYRALQERAEAERRDLANMAGYLIVRALEADKQRGERKGDEIP